MSLIISRPFGFAIELLIEDSPLMVNSLAEEFAKAVTKTSITERIKALLEPAKRPPVKQEPQVQTKSGVVIPTGKGFQRPNRKKSQ